MTLPIARQPSKRRRLQKWNNTDLATREAHKGYEAPTGQLALTGPAFRAEQGHLPVRGDLAHIRLAGRFFVPHYAVPMPHAVKAGGSQLRATKETDAEVICDLADGAIFDVLDIAGGWCWGQFGENGPVGYVALSDLEPIGT